MEVGSEGSVNGARSTQVRSGCGRPGVEPASVGRSGSGLHSKHMVGYAHSGLGTELGSLGIPMTWSQPVEPCKQ